MGDLPWLVMHGELVWKAALAASGVGGFGWGGLRAVVAARRDAHDAREALGAPVSSLDGVAEGATVTVEGTLDAAGELDQIPGEHTPVGTGAMDLAVVVGGARVALRLRLRGVVAVTAGSHEVRTGTGGPSRDDDSPWSPALRALRPGDRVLARGVLRTGAARDANVAGYRVSAARQPTLTGAQGAPVTVAWAGGSPAVQGPEIGRRLRGALLAVLTCALALWMVGDLGLRWTRLHGTPGELAAEVASAMPGRREEALRALDARALAGTPGPAVPGRRVALALLRGDCLGAVEVAMAHGALPEAARVAERCGRRRAAARAWYGHGDFVRASEDFGRQRLGSDNRSELDFELEVHLLAGRPAIAAEVTDRIAAMTEADARATRWAPEVLPRALERVGGLRCAADALRVRAGDLVSRGRLRVAAMEGGRACAMLWADLQPAGSEARRKALAAHSLEGPSGEALQQVVRLLWAETAPEREQDENWWTYWTPFPWSAVDAPENLLGSPHEMLAGQLPGLERAVLPGLTTPSPLRVMLSARAAAFEALAGMQVAAETHAVTAERDAALFAPMSSVVLGTDTEHLAALRAAVMQRGRGGVPALPGATGDGNAGWQAVATGDGARMAVLARSLDVPDETSPWVYLGARRVTRNREALARWIHWGSVPRAWDRPALDRLAAVANRHDAAVALGDRALADELAGVRARYTAALESRDLAVVRAVVTGP